MPAPTPVRLGVESLEPRDVPSTLSVADGGREVAHVASDAGGVYRMQTDRGWERLSPGVTSALALNDAGGAAVGLPGGVYRWADATGWQRLTRAHAGRVDIDDAGRVLAAFPGAGLWLFDTAGAWTLISRAEATALAIDDEGGVAAGFAGGGLWHYSFGGGWARLSPFDSVSLDVDQAGRVAAGFAGAGLWLYAPASGWAKLSALTPTTVAADETGGVVGGFGPYGVWRHRGSWQKLSAVGPAEVDVDAAGNVAARYGAADVWLYAGTAWQHTTAGVGTRTVIDLPHGIVYIPGGVRTVGQDSPILFAFHPSADAAFTVGAFAAHAERWDFILFADKYYRNDLGDLAGGLNAPAYATMRGRIDAALAALPADPTRVMLTGTSGGASFAHALNLKYPGLCDALIVNTGMVWGRTIPEDALNVADWSGYGAGNATALSSQYAATSRRLVVFLASGTDFRHEEMERDFELYGRLGWRRYWTEFPGGHVHAPATKYHEAFQYVMSHVAWVG